MCGMIFCDCLIRFRGISGAIKWLRISTAVTLLNDLMLVPVNTLHYFICDLFNDIASISIYNLE
jgi:hypothetical protein